VAIRAGRRNEAIKRPFGVGGNVRIGVLVNQNASGRVRDVKEARASFDAERGNHSLDFLRHVRHLGAPGGPHAN
jgi:hypothetical protein